MNKESSEVKVTDSNDATFVAMQKKIEDLTSLVMTLLQDKKEIFKGIGGKFVMSTVVSLKKVNNIVAAQTVSSHASSGYIKSSVQTKSSANLAGTNKSVKAKKK